MRLPIIVALGLLPSVLPAQATAPVAKRLAAPDRVLEHDFTQIRGLRELPHGRLLLTDRLEPALYVVAAGSGGLTRIGREGEGPAEYRLPGMLLPWPGDSTLMTDEGNLRLLVIGPDLKIHREMSNERPGLNFGLYPRAVDTRGRVYFQIPAWSMGENALPDDSVEVARIDLKTGAVEKLGVVKGMTQPPGNIRYGLPYVPFSPEDVWQAAPDGRVVFVRSGDYHLEWRGADGRVTRSPAIPFTPIPVAEQDRVTHTRTFLENSTMSGRAGAGAPSTGIGAVPSEWLSPKRVAELVEKNTFATRKGPFTDQPPRLSPAGALWVERSIPAGAARVFDVFDPAGRLTQRVTLPAGRRLLVVGRAGVYLVATTADGLERLERYPCP